MSLKNRLVRCVFIKSALKLDTTFLCGGSFSSYKQEISGLNLHSALPLMTEPKCLERLLCANTAGGNNNLTGWKKRSFHSIIALTHLLIRWEPVGIQDTQLPQTPETTSKSEIIIVSQELVTELLSLYYLFIDHCGHKREHLNTPQSHGEHCRSPPASGQWAHCGCSWSASGNCAVPLTSSWSCVL